MNKQEKNTINAGDALRDLVHAIQNSANKQAEIKGLWHGSIESDKIVKPYDLIVKPNSQTHKLLGLPANVCGRLGFGYGGSNVRTIKADIYENLGKQGFQLEKIASGMDYYIHIRKNNTETGHYMHIVPQNKLQAYFDDKGKANRQKKQNQIVYQWQLNTSGTLPKETGKPWKNNLAWGNIIPADHLIEVAEELLLQVNEAGRKASEANSSNVKNNSRQVGNPYKER